MLSEVRQTQIPYNRTYMWNQETTTTKLLIQRTVWQWVKWVKGVKRFKFLVIKQLSLEGNIQHGDYNNMNCICENC